MSREIGQDNESIAAKSLELEGYQIIARNFLTRFGEIDIVAKDGEHLVFVEVKFRKNCEYGSPGEFIEKRKISKIIKASKHYLFQNELMDTNWRLDAVLITDDTIEILKNIYTEGL